MTTPVDSSAVVDLLGVLAYAELTAFDRLAEDARLAPTLAGRAALARMAAAEIAHHCRLTERLDRARASTRRGPWRRSSPRWTPSTRAPGPAPGWRAWSRPTSATGWPPTSTARSPRSCPTPTGAGARGARRHRPRGLRRPRGAGGDRRRPPRRRPAVPVGTAARRRGDDPVPGGHRRARPAGRADHRRHRRPRRASAG